MRRVQRLKEIAHITRPVVAIGVFDGLHHGHRRLVDLAKQRAKAIKGTSVVLTFDPHPVHVLHPRRDWPLIVSAQYRLKLLEEVGVDVCWLVRFTRRFAGMAPERFVQEYLVKALGAREIIVGEDFCFGKKRKGDITLLKAIAEKSGIKVHIIKIRKKHGNKAVSSSRIREFLKHSDIVHAADLLDRPVSLMGKVIRGDRRGRCLGFPTANLASKDVGLAPLGIYCVRVWIGKKALPGVANIGRRPSFKKHDDVSIEVYIFDFNKDLYGKEIRVDFFKKIRDEKKFKDVAKLKKQMENDEIFARRWFANYFSSCL